MSQMGLDFFLMNFVGALGVLQISAAYSPLRGMLFIQRRLLSGVLGFLVLIGAFLWFFISEPRNLPDTGGGLSGNEDTWLFCAACTCAILSTLAISSIINRKKHEENPSYPSGLEALREATFYRVFAEAVRKLWAMRS